jgi:hypothetical protein
MICCGGSDDQIRSISKAGVLGQVARHKKKADRPVNTATIQSGIVPKLSIGCPLCHRIAKTIKAHAVIKQNAFSTTHFNLRHPPGGFIFKGPT